MKNRILASAVLAFALVGGSASAAFADEPVVETPAPVVETTPVVESTPVEVVEPVEPVVETPVVEDEPVVEPIYLPAPVQNDGCGVEEDPYAAFGTPDIDGVVYGIYDYTGIDGSSGWPQDYGWQPGDAFVIIAGPEGWGRFGDTPIEVEPSDYGIDSGGNVGWWFPAFSDAPCFIFPAPVTYADECGTENDVLETPTVDHLIYTVEVRPEGHFRIYVTTDSPDYALLVEGLPYYSERPAFTDEPCEEEPPVVEPGEENPAPVDVVPAANVTPLAEATPSQTGALASTGYDATGFYLIGGAAFVLGAAVIAGSVIGKRRANR